MPAFLHVLIEGGRDGLAARDAHQGGQAKEDMSWCVRRSILQRRPPSCVWTTPGLFSRQKMASQGLCLLSVYTAVNTVQV